MPKLKVPRFQHRNFAIIERGDPIVEKDDEGNETRKYPLTFSSETPVLRWSWDGRYYEILSHDPADVDMSVAADGLPMLKSHNRELHHGSVEDVMLQAAQKALGGNARFASTQLGQEQETMVKEGHTKRVSVGYRIISAELVSKDEETGIPTYRVKWMPVEVSTEPIPADQTVGFGRALEGDGPLKERDGIEKIDMVELEVEGERAAVPSAEGERTMGEEIRGTTPTAPETPATPPTVDRSKVEKERNAQVADVLALCKAHDIDMERASEWIREGFSMERVQREILDTVSTRGPVPTQPSAEALGVSKRDLDNYSYLKALQISAGVRKHEGLEAELHDELASRGNGAQHNGILVPLRLRRPEEPSEYGNRTLGITEPGSAAVVGTQRMELIDILRKKARVLEFGARFIPGLTGIVMMPKKTGEATVQWMAENPAADASDSESEYKYILMAPKTLIGTVPVPRQLIAVESFDVEADIMNDLGLGTTMAIDLGSLHGTGTNKQPVGIYSAADVQSKAIDGVPAYEDFTSMVGMVADENADFGSLAWMTTPLMAAKMKATPVVDGYPVFIWDGKVSDGEMAGYRAGATNQVSKTLGDGEDEHGLVFGNWNELVIGMWGNELELVVDVLSEKKKGIIEITSFAMGDVAIRHPEAFVKATGAVLSAG